VVHSAHIEGFFLFLEILSKKMRNSQVLIERKAMRMFSNKEKRSNKVSRVERAKMESPINAWLAVH